ncbi:MAG: hypothetical protein WB797_10990, partial [Nocardioides sp.]
GVVVAQQLPQQDASSNASAGASAQHSLQTRPGDSGNGKVKSPGALTPTVGPARVRHGRIVVHAKHFSADALAGRALMNTRFASKANTDVTGRSSCVVAPAHSQLLKALFRGAPAVLVYHRPAGTTQVVDLFVCGTSQPLRSVTLPTD